MKLGIDYIPHGLLAKYTIQCIHPETGKEGSWLYIGESHRTKGTAISPFFPDSLDFYKWAEENGWKHCSGSPTAMIHE